MLSRIWGLPKVIVAALNIFHFIGVQVVHCTVQLDKYKPHGPNNIFRNRAPQNLVAAQVGMIFISIITAATVPNSWGVGQEPVPCQTHTQNQSKICKL